MTVSYTPDHHAQCNSTPRHTQGSATNTGHFSRYWLPAVLLLLTGQLMNAQQTYSYQFNQQPFQSTPAGGPDLQTLGTVTTPVTVTIPVTTCPLEPVVDLSHFTHNSGFAAKAFFTNTYSIEVIFWFEELDGYNRVIDFSNSLSDNGIYTLNTCLNFFPVGTIGPCPNAFDLQNYKQLVVTRDGDDQTMNIYLNGELFTTHVDVQNRYVIGAAPNDTIKFFRDDNVIGNEASPGHVAFIRMADHALSQAQVEASFEEFCSNILTTLKEEDPGMRLRLFPNPVQDQLRIQPPPGMTPERIELLDARGTLVREWQVKAGQEETVLSLSGLPQGVYSLRCSAPGQAPVIGRVIKTE